MKKKTENEIFYENNFKKLIILINPWNLYSIMTRKKEEREKRWEWKMKNYSKKIS